MSEGISVELAELIALRRFSHTATLPFAKMVAQSGGHNSRLRGRGMDFAEARNYQAGDELRHMEWRVTARTGRPHVKVFQEERERVCLLVVDFNPSLYFGTQLAFKSVVAAKLAALIAWTVVQQGDKLGALLCSESRHQEFLPRSREAAALPILAALAEMTQQLPKNNQIPAISPLSGLLSRLNHLARPGSLIVLISDFCQLDPELEQQLRRLRARHDFLAYAVADPLELAVPSPGDYAISDGQSAIALDTKDSKVRQAYQQYVDDRKHQLESLWKGLDSPCFSLTANSDLPKLIDQSYPRRRPC